MTDDDINRIAAGQAAQREAVDATMEDVDFLAHKFAPNAMRVLALVAANGKNENARVAAAKSIVDIDRANRAAGMPVRTDPLGKKELQLEAARIAAAAAEFGDVDLSPPGYKN